MSRRSDKSFQRFIDEHLVDDGEGGFDMDWEGAAKSLGGVPAKVLKKYDGVTSIAPIEAAVRELFYESFGEVHSPAPLAMVTLECQGCGRRVDAWRVRASRWISSDSAEEGWVLRASRVTSERWASEVGDSIGELFRHFEGRSMSFDCACGRKDLQFSVRRIRETLADLTPTSPRWSTDASEPRILWPATRRETIRG